MERALARLEADKAVSLRRTLESMAGGRATDRAEPGAVEPGPPDRIGVPLGSRTILVPVEEIDWIEADGDYARLHAGDRTHLVAERMSALEELLGRERFLRIHRSVMVNLARVRELHRDPDGGGAVVLDSDVRLRVARRRWEEMERALGL